MLFTRELRGREFRFQWLFFGEAADPENTKPDDAQVLASATTADLSPVARITNHLLCRISSDTQLETKALTSRALRRHHEKRIKRRVEKYYGGVHRNDPRRIGQIARARKLCSCWMCGNPRRYFNEAILRETRLSQESQLYPD
jgi:hypothetical protein